MTDEEKRTYQVRQYFYDESGARNEDVRSFGDLVTHHPKANFKAQMIDGELQNVERPSRRSHAFIGGALQEVEMLRTDEYGALKSDQVLLIKDFILEHPDHPTRSNAARAVEIPSPVAGYVGRRDDRQGLIDIYDKPDGDVIARIRHMDPISVNIGDLVVYGQSLGTQHEKGLRPGTGKHVHMEVDTRYYQQFESYVSDLVSGRLPVQAEFRENVGLQVVIGDGTFRLGESNERILDLQRAMANEGYLAAGGGPLDRDGVYRPGMQGALLDFQRDHGIPQTGDIDPATLNFAPPARLREVDRQDHFEPGRPMPPAEQEPPRAPGHPDHPDHRPGLPEQLEPPVNQRSPRTGSTGDPQLDRLADALYADDEARISRVCAEIERSPDVQALIAQGRETLAIQERERDQQGFARHNQEPALSLG